MRLILASQSPSRCQLLERLGVAFDTDQANLDETPHAHESPRAYSLRISKEKAQKVAMRHQGKYILSADTSVSVGRRILGKAQTEQEAFQQLILLSGRRHRVYTALTLYSPQHLIQQRICITQVAFKVLEPQEIKAFVRSREWENVSVYRYEGIAGQFIRFMKGLPSAIAGLPLYDTCALLKGHGFLQYTERFSPPFL